jgi:hypothetical protein
MSTKSDSNWLGFISILWMAAGLAFKNAILDRYPFEFRPTWLYFLASSVFLFGIWWGIGLLFAVSALRRRSLAGRICAIISICAFLYSAWDIMSPIFLRARSSAALPNKSLTNRCRQQPLPLPVEIDL